MVFNEALTEYLIDGLSEALAGVDEPTSPMHGAAGARCGMCRHGSRLLRLRKDHCSGLSAKVEPCQQAVCPARLSRR